MQFWPGLCSLSVLIGLCITIFHEAFPEPHSLLFLDGQHNTSFTLPCIFLQVCFEHYNPLELLDALGLENTSQTEVAFRRALEDYCLEDLDFPDPRPWCTRHAGYMTEQASLACDPEKNEHCPALMVFEGEGTPADSTSCDPPSCDSSCMRVLETVREYLGCCARSVYGEAWASQFLGNLTSDTPCGSVDARSIKCIRRHYCGDNYGFTSYKDCL